MSSQGREIFFATAATQFEDYRDATSSAEVPLLSGVLSNSASGPTVGRKQGKNSIPDSLDEIELPIRIHQISFVDAYGGSLYYEWKFGRGEWRNPHVGRATCEMIMELFDQVDPSSVEITMVHSGISKWKWNAMSRHYETDGAGPMSWDAVRKLLSAPEPVD